MTPEERATRIAKAVYPPLVPSLVSHIAAAIRDAENDALERAVVAGERIKRLERRIHNQRVALRRDWQIVDMRTGLAQPKEVRSRLLAGWCRASHEARELRERLAKYEPVSR